MIYELSQRFFFESAHTLVRDIDAAGSRRIHGHTYHAEITVRGPVDEATGMLVDLGRVRAAIENIRGQLDHRFLDEVRGLGPATLENLCRFILSIASEQVSGVCAVCVERAASGDKCVLRSA
jgi:6-pyruvoyltetrahydropterin/6-carboxytetrahydropterin synthase